MKQIKISLLAFMALTTISSAADVAEKYTNTKSVKATDELKQSINLGFSSTSGNSETLNINGRDWEIPEIFLSECVTSKPLASLFN